MNKQLVLRGDQGYSTSDDARLLRGVLEAGVDLPPVSSEVGRRVFATESISEADMSQVNAAANNFQAMLASVASSLGYAKNDNVTIVQESAAAQGALAASAPAAFVKRDHSFSVAGSSTLLPVRAERVTDYLGHRSELVVNEAFDNRETRSSVLYTMAYNYAVSRQDEFGETVWPTLTLPADQIGFGIVVNRLTVHRGVTHEVSGKVVDFKKVDLMRAEADHTILLRERTRIYPIARPAAAAKLVDASIIAPRTFNNEGVEIQTAPYRVGVEIGILGISQTEASLAGGLNNQTDTVDPAMQLEKLYVTVGGDVLGFNVYNKPGSNFVQAPQGQDKQRNLTFRDRAIMIKPNTTQYEGSALVDLAAVATNNLTVVLELNASGQSNTEFGTAQVFGNAVNIVKVLDEDGNVLPSTHPLVADLEALFATAKIVGYDLRAYRTNINMRERGDFVDSTQFTQLYEIPLLSPVTAQRPQNADARGDTTDFEALVTHTRFRLKTDAVTEILNKCDELGEFVQSSLTVEEAPYGIGAARFHVKPVFYRPAPIEVSTIVDSLASAKRTTDLRHAIVNVVRDYALRMFITSEYKAAMSALGYNGPVTVIAATDPELAAYLMLEGELRTLSQNINLRVVSTLDRRMKGKIFLTFGIFDENRNQAPHLLNWGNLVWAPEVVMSASVPRGESMSRETIVQPRYRFINHLPVATLLEFNGLPEVFSKLPMQFKNV